MIVGLTGGIASGKSLVAECFARHGVPLLDADQVAREVVAPETPGLRRVLETFGDDYRRTDGTLDRARLRRLVFADSEARRRLEAIVHPLIRERVVAWRTAVTARYAIYSAALLIESGMLDQVDRVLVVDAPPELQIERLTRRDGIDAALARAMLAAQASAARRLARADDLIDNRAAAAALKPQVERLHRLYLRLAGG